MGYLRLLYFVRNGACYFIHWFPTELYLTRTLVNMIVLVLGQKLTTMINMIETTKTDEWPTGLAQEIWAEFKARFAPEDDIAEMDTEEDLPKV